MQNADGTTFLGFIFAIDKHRIDKVFSIRSPFRLDEEK
jgi:hypothetical protein